MIDRLIRHRRWFLVVLLIATTTGLIVRFAGQQVTASSPSLADLAPMQIEIAFPNLTLSLPFHLAHAGDGTDRIFVVEQTGRIHVF